VMAKRMLGLERSEWSFWRKWMLVSMVAWTGVGGAGSVVFFLAYASLYSLGGSLSDVMDLFRPLVAGWALLGAGIGRGAGDLSMAPPEQPPAVRSVGVDRHFGWSCGWGRDHGLARARCRRGGLAQPFGLSRDLCHRRGLWWRCV
jgi:hypothetical protein